MDPLCDPFPANKGVFMRLVAFLAFLAAVCSATPGSQDQFQTPNFTSGVASEGQKPSADSPLEFLLTSSANDFRAHQPPTVERFREVRFGHIVATDGQKRSLLCGEFLPRKQEGKAEWTPFATIQTGKTVYEQWLGGQATGLCRPSQFVRDDATEFSSELQKRLDSLR
jgi:hypothetical protein